MPECDYCGEEVSRTGGKMLVRSTGEKLYFCSNKCQQNYERDRSHDYAEKEP